MDNSDDPAMVESSCIQKFLHYVYTSLAIDDLQLAEIDDIIVSSVYYTHIGGYNSQQNEDYNISIHEKKRLTLSCIIVVLICLINNFDYDKLCTYLDDIKI